MVEYSQNEDLSTKLFTFEFNQVEEVSPVYGPLPLAEFQFGTLSTATANCMDFYQRFR